MSGRWPWSCSSRGWPAALRLGQQGAVQVPVSALARPGARGIVDRLCPRPGRRHGLWGRRRHPGQPGHRSPRRNLARAQAQLEGGGGHGHGGRPSGAGPTNWCVPKAGLPVLSGHELANWTTRSKALALVVQRTLTRAGQPPAGALPATATGPSAQCAAGGGSKTFVLGPTLDPGLGPSSWLTPLAELADGCPRLTGSARRAAPVRWPDAARGRGPLDRHQRWGRQRGARPGPSNGGGQVPARSS